ncbi:MAG: DUF418 domain-containing protein [Acidimicrobiia bacterium]|nr:DUF418 domain-containing protein [Acidimicrobiia bacterium]
MDLKPAGRPLLTSVAAGSRPRLPGPDVVRALALTGVVVMNYHGYLILRGGERGTGSAATFFDPWVGPLATRFAATFVLVAGVGVTLMTRRCRASGRGVTEMRFRLVRRGLVLYVGGLLLDEVWAGTIIPFYGAMFVLAAVMFTLRSRWLVVIAVSAASAGWAIRWWRWEQELAGESTAWLTSPDSGSILSPAYDVFVNGTHPLFPWLVFFCCGMLLARAFDSGWWRTAALAGGFGLFALANLVNASATTGFERVFLSTDPLQRGAIYSASALGTALVAYATIDWLAERFTGALDPLRRAGQMTLSLYLAHVLVFKVFVEWSGWIEPAGLDVSLTFALTFWVVAILAALAWSARLGLGPAERLYRALGG